ncbi:MAG: energy transducer TonB [Pseudomonas sp.]|uniref:energy transducer TonB n=1 Tax=Pseudomonas sp. TaxID=306 RepID=UPI003391F816
MIGESRRLAYLSAMQVDSWLPRVVLPFAAPSPLRWQAPDEPIEAQPPAPASVASVGTAAPTPIAPQATAAAPVTDEPRPRVEVPRPVAKVVATLVEQTTAAPARNPAVAPPRFALQLLRAGDCVLLVELPTGETFTSRDPAYLLLKDLLRAAGLPDSPQLLGEPVRWPLLQRGALDQGPQAALEYVQGFIGAQLEQAGECRCLWLVGLPAVRFAGEADAGAYHRELQVEGLGNAWAVPGLEAMLDEPLIKAEVWQAMRRVMRRWKSEE